MTTVRIDFDTKRIQIHRKPDCKGYEIKPEDCVVNLNRSDTSELSKFGTGEIGPDNKVIWMNLDFSDPYFEHAIVEYVRELLSPDHKIFTRTRSIGWHC
jgi:hypothetical protein